MDPQKPLKPAIAPEDKLIAPTEEVWRAMSASERERFILSANEFLAAQAEQRLGRMVNELHERREQAETRAEEERARALEAQRRAVIDILTVRGVPVSDPMRVALAACADPERLSRWIVRAAVASSDAEVIDGAAQ